jgi:glucose/mannose-6-phosphate isomerase
MPISVLDDLQQIRSIDKDSMHRELAEMPEHLAKLYNDSGPQARELGDTLRERIDNVLLAGMGSSAMAAYIEATWLAGRSQIPVQVLRDYHVPSYADENTLFIGVSKSGETRETIWATQEALKRECQVACVSVGGRLRNMCSQRAAPFFQIGDTTWARTGTLQLIGALTAVTEEVLELVGVSEEVSDADKALRDAAGDIDLSVPQADNPMKQAAVRISDSDLSVLATYRLRAIGDRLVQQINENSKRACYLGIMPDAMHNFVLQFRGTPDTSLIVLRGQNDDPVIARMTGELVDRVRNRVIDIITVEGTGESHLAELTAALLRTDYLSYYLSVLNGVDPGPTPELKQLRKTLTTLESPSEHG